MSDTFVMDDITMKRLWLAVGAALLFAAIVLSSFLRQNPASAAAMEIVGQFGGAVYDVAVDGSHAYVGVGPRLVVLDVSEHGQPNKMGKTEIMAGIVRSVALSDKYAYAGAGAAGMYVIDISDPSQPAIVGVHATGGYAEDVAVAGDLVYIASSPVWDGSRWTGDSLQIVDTADPTAPSLVATHETPGWE